MLLVLLMRFRVVAHVTELASEGDSLILQVSFIVIVVQSPSRVRLSATQWTVASSELAATAWSCQSCPTLCYPIDVSPPGSHPWDSPGKNTRVGCHFLLQCMKVKSESEVAQSCLTL